MMKAHNEDATMNLFQSSLLIGTSNSSLVINVSKQALLKFLSLNLNQKKSGDFLDTK